MAAQAARPPPRCTALRRADRREACDGAAQPSGPLVLVVSLSKQTVTVYDDGKQIAKSPISSGMSGHPTPTGIFSILEKNRYHYSNLYGGAPMPFMQRVTNSGVAMHAGDLPGYPASHGCIRLPYSFARNLFGITEIGARVIISNEDLTPAEFNSPHLIGPLPPDNVVQNDAATVQAAATGASNIIGVSPAAAGEGVRTRGMAAAQRAAERNRLVTAIVEAENAKAAAEDQAKAATAAAQEAKETIRKERNEEGRLAELARKAAKAADSAASRFTSLTAKMAKVDVAQLDAATLEKQSAEEVAEEAKMLDAADAAAAAKRAAEAQTAKAKQAVADAGALEKARKVAVEDVKQAETVVASAKDALAAADALEARKDYPVSVFISGKTGRLVAKLGFVQVMDVPVTISEPGRPLGTHVLTATTFTDGGEGAALALGNVEAVADRAVCAAQEAPARGRGAGRGWRPRCRPGGGARAHRYPERGRRPARRADEAGLLVHHLRLRAQPRDQRADGIRRRAVAQPIGYLGDAVLLISPMLSSRITSLTLGFRDDSLHGLTRQTDLTLGRRVHGGDVIADRDAAAFQHLARDAATPFGMQHLAQTGVRLVHACTRRRRICHLEQDGADAQRRPDGPRQAHTLDQQVGAPRCPIERHGFAICSEVGECRLPVLAR
ncbi:MAG: L,D-transpeptidase family protein [Hyphomicrobium sp.]|nr:L,D-transpeptidase family protein [Hyphomicrobium sp.]